MTRRANGSTRRAPWRRGAVACSVLLTLVTVPVASSASGPDGGKPDRGQETAQNVILLVGDGMGDSEITAARDYTVGAGGRLAMDRLPMTGTSLTHSVDERGRPDYVTDSAAGASAWATGHKTVNGRVSKTAGTNRPVPTVLELARRQGYAVGSVTTESVADATPAALTAHATDRSCKGPADMAACPADTRARGGAGSVAEQTVALRPDVLLGGGTDVFAQTVTDGPHRGRTVLEQARAGGYQVVRDSAGLKAARSGQPVLGLFAPAAVPVEWTGAPAVVGGTRPQRCAVHNPARPAGTPTLEESTRAALDLLTARHERSGPAGKGFFLQVEGASIDDRSHDADPCGQIGETVAFDRAVAAALAYADAHPRTLVIVTADHGHAGQVLPVDARPPGRSSTLITDEGALLQLGYASGAPDDVQEHTGVQVRIAARGPQAHRVLGVHDNTALFGTLRSALGLR
ncbi:alkaline phosphatase [Streptomyces griseocarneus]|uniref:alkaline phosphatase n=1 Tax=Streptomyces griseocarneus TaxID=51201 RepID=UPI00167CB505|nr:alkaline phosphatase [Streptomyces griseocarneus]MBZ6474055.1 alkaline phosphatase [Streptomyces griseocarneus]GHG51866.1 alkaline phosphatase [Streptomyces griseocarneus]